MNRLFEDKLANASRKGLARILRQVDGPQGRAVKIDGREVLLFCSNNYLGMANHPVVKNAVSQSLEREGWGSGASRLVSGTMRAHTMFEERVAEYLGKESALLFSSGWMANVGVLTALMGRGDIIHADRLCHASIIDGARLSGATLKRYRHADPDSLVNALKKNTGRGKQLIVTDGVFSMDGDIAPLRELAQIAERFGALLMVDDAHGFGMFGPGGRGTPYLAGVEQRVDIHVATLGKALGGVGGFVAGSRCLVDGLINFARSFIYSTALTPSSASAGLTALEIVAGDEGDARRARLNKNISRAVSDFKKLGYNVIAGQTQIIPVFVKPGCDGIQAMGQLLDSGVYVQIIRPPTVPENTTRFRLSLMSDHTEDDISRMTEAFVGIKDFIVE